MPVIIEPMDLDDLPDVVAIEDASFEEPWSKQSFQSELAHNELALYLVARLGGCIAGYAGAWVILDEAHITTLAVEQNCRRMGIASRLLEALIEKSFGLGARRISLEVRPSNRAARRLYEKFGFTVKGVRKRYYFNEDGLVMFKENLNGGMGSDGPAS